MSINKPVAGQSIARSVHIYLDNCTVRCVGSSSDDRADYTEWTTGEKTILHKAVGLILGKLGEYESGDQAKIVSAMNDKAAEIVASKVEVETLP